MQVESSPSTQVAPLGTRFWARCCDYALCGLIVSAGCVPLDVALRDVALRWPLLHIPAVLLFWMPVEAICLRYWGRTPGQALFGVWAQDPAGGAISLPRACKSAFLFCRRGICLYQSSSARSRKRTRKVVGVLLTLLSVGGAALSSLMTTDGRLRTVHERPADPAWQTYFFDDEGFSIALPGAPVKEDRVMDIRKYHRTLDYEEYVSQAGPEASYSVSCMKFPRSWRFLGGGVLLNGALDVLVENIPGASLLAKEATKFGNYRSVDFQVQDGERRIIGKLILMGTKLFKLSCSAPASQRVDPSGFFDSFARLD